MTTELFPVKNNDKKISKPHFYGHRSRLRQRFLEGGESSLADYELLEIILFAAKPRGDVKPLAKMLIKEFGSFEAVLRAEIYELEKIADMGEAAITAIKATQAATKLLLRQRTEERPILSSWQSLLDYCTVQMGHKKTEQFRIIFLNHKNRLLADEVQNHGTINHTPVYPREVIKRALELGAAAVILCHNHPSGDPTPSQADMDITEAIVKAARTLGIKVHDHLIIAGGKHFSFKSHELI